MAQELSINATMKNEMAGLLLLKSQTLAPGASWVQAPPGQIAGNVAAAFSAACAGGASLDGSVVYLPQGSTTELTFTFSVDGKGNTATASYHAIGPTVGAQITQGDDAVAIFSYAR